MKVSSWWSCPPLRTWWRLSRYGGVRDHTPGTGNMSKSKIYTSLSVSLRVEEYLLWCHPVDQARNRLYSSSWAFHKQRGLSSEPHFHKAVPRSDWGMRFLFTLTRHHQIRVHKPRATWHVSWCPCWNRIWVGGLQTKGFERRFWPYLRQRETRGTTQRRVTPEIPPLDPPPFLIFHRIQVRYVSDVCEFLWILASDGHLGSSDG